MKRMLSRILNTTAWAQVSTENWDSASNSDSGSESFPYCDSDRRRAVGDPGNKWPNPTRTRDSKTPGPRPDPVTGGKWTARGVIEYFECKNRTRVLDFIKIGGKPEKGDLQPWAYYM